MLKPKILLIHPDPSFRDAVAVCLAEHGYYVCHAAGGKDGLQLLYKVHPDLVLVEMSDPPGNSSAHEDGWQTLQRIRLFTDIPAIVIANQLSELSEQRARAIQATELVSAPIAPAELAAQVALMVERVADREAGARLESKQSEVDPLPLSRFLNQDQLLQLDRAIRDVGELGEVHLIKYRGRLRFIAKIKTERYQPVHA